MDFRKRYIAFLNRLETIAENNDELTDTEARERLRDVVNYYFIWDKPLADFPKRFEMMSERADKAVAKAVREFIVDARKIAAAARIKAGAARHALIEDEAAESRDGNLYDVFLGSVDKVWRADKPEPDSSIESYDGEAEKNAVKPLYEVEQVAVKVRGKTFVPRYDGESGMYCYTGRGGVGHHFSQDFYAPAALLRAAAIAALSGNEEEEERITQKLIRKSKAAKSAKAAKRKAARKK